MAISVGNAVGWVEQHPIESIVIGGGVVVVLIWLFAGGKGNQGDDGASNMAAAYYAAEAQQAVVGGQIQVANINAVRDTAIATIAGDTQTKLGAIQATAAETINTTNAGVAIENIHGQVAMNASNNDAAWRIAEAQSKASTLSDFFHTVIPAELAQYGGSNFSTTIPDLGTFGVGYIGSRLSPNQLRIAGYSEAQIAAMT